MKNKPVVLCIMDGWGINENKNYNLAERPKNSKMSTIKFSKYFNEEILSWENDFNNFINKNNIDA